MNSKKDMKFRPFVSHSAVDGLSVLFVLILLFCATNDMDGALWNLPWGVLFAIAGVFAIFLYRLYQTWDLVSELPGRTTPLKAAGFMLIPIFNFYWAFVAVNGLTDDMNILLQKKGATGKSVSKNISIAFSIIFPLTFLSLFYMQGVLLFFILFLAMLFVTRRLVWEWRQAAWRLTGNIDEIDNASRSAGSGSYRSIISGTGIVIVSVLLSAFIVIWVASSFIVPGVGYRDRVHMNSFKVDLTNAYAAAQAYLIDHPTETVNSEKCLTSKGWIKSYRTVFVSADMTKQKGRIVLKNTYLEKRRSYEPGIGTVNAEGKISLPGEKTGAEGKAF